MRGNLVLDIESQILLQFIVFFYSTEAHILEDVNKCVQALQDKDPETVDRTAGQIRGRTARLEDVVTAEMENYQQGPYTDNVFRAVLIMHNEGIDYFLTNNAILLNHLEQAKRFVPKTFVSVHKSPPILSDASMHLLRWH